MQRCIQNSGLVLNRMVRRRLQFCIKSTRLFLKKNPNCIQNLLDGSFFRSYNSTNKKLVVYSNFEQFQNKFGCHGRAYLRRCFGYQNIVIFLNLLGFFEKTRPKLLFPYKKISKHGFAPDVMTCEIFYSDYCMPIASKV